MKKAFHEEPYDEDNLLFTIGNSLYKYALIITADNIASIIQRIKIRKH